MNEEQRLVQKRMRVLEHAKKTGNVRKTCRYFGIARSSFYRWMSQLSFQLSFKRRQRFHPQSCAITPRVTASSSDSGPASHCDRMA